MTSSAPSVATSLNHVSLIVLRHPYSQYGYSAESKVHRTVTAILHSDFPDAAWKIRSALWDALFVRRVAARATCNLFYALGREKELGIVTKEAGGYDAEDYNLFLSGLVASKRAAINAYTQ